MLTAAEAAALEAKLAQKYQLEWVTAQVGPVQFKLLQLAGLEDYLVNRIEAEGLALENFPFWAMVWEAALVLADFLVRQEPDPHRDLLELGAGLGFAGLAAAARGHRVTLTDNNPEALDFIRLSIYANQLHQAQAAFLDWSQPTVSGRFDWLIGADILYEEATFPALDNLFRRYLKPGGYIYLAQALRGPATRRFFELLKDRYQIKYREKHLTTAEGKKKILFLALQPR